MSSMAKPHAFQLKIWRALFFHQHLEKPEKPQGSKWVPCHPSLEDHDEEAARAAFTSSSIFAIVSGDASGKCLLMFGHE